MFTRRMFLGGVIAAPAIVRFESLMPVRYFGWDEQLRSNIFPTDPALFEQIRKSYMRYLANDLCSVQPMLNSAGKVFALKSKYSDNRFNIVSSINEPGGGVDILDIFERGVESYPRESRYKRIGENNFHIDIPLRIDNQSRHVTSNTETS